jgi:hypothetical protein
MKKPPFDVIVGALFVIASSFQPLIELSTDKVTLLSSNTPYFLVGMAVLAVLAASYGGQTRGCIGLAVTIALTPIASKVMMSLQIQEEFRLTNVVHYSSECWGIWFGSLGIFVAASRQLLKEAREGTLDKEEA